MRTFLTNQVFFYSLKRESIIKELLEERIEFELNLPFYGFERSRVGFVSTENENITGLVHYEVAGIHSYNGRV